MSHQILPFSLALSLGLLWVIYMPRVVLRLSGIAVPWSPFRRLLPVSGNLARFVLQVGVLTVGIACLIFDLSNRYIRWAMYGNPSDRITTGHVIEQVLGCLFVGILYGLLIGLMDSRKSRR